jgi:hypothetical protein
MRLDHGVIRELHWHKEAEWAYVLDGEVRVTALDYEGGNFIDDLKKGDLWVRQLADIFKMASIEILTTTIVFPKWYSSLSSGSQPQWYRVSPDF